MKKIALFFGLSATLAAGMLACFGDDELYDRPSTPGRDASVDATLPDSGAGDGAASDAGGDAGPVPTRLLLSYNGATNSELVALDPATGKVDGRYVYPARFGTTYARGATPFLLEQAIDVVARLDEREPWKVVSTWNVRGDDGKDGGASYADPAAVVVSAADKAYVLRFNRNRIFVIDPREVADGGAEKKAIDLSSFLQAGDTDGVVEPTAAVFVPSRKRLYVLLNGVDLSKVAADGFTYLCSALKSSIVAIDTDTDQVVSAGGAGPGGSLLLDVHNVPLGIDLVYDATKDAILVLGAGCNTDSGGGVAGPVVRRMVQEVALANGALTTRVDLSASGFPLGFQYVSSSLALIGFFGEVYAWDPRTTALGPKLPGNLESFVHDGQGSVYGTRVTTGPDGGSAVEVVRTTVPAADAGADAAPPAVQILATDPFASGKGGFLNGAELWPRR